MDYASFKEYLTTFLWKAGDSILIANLDNLIKMANHELDRVLKVERRHSGAPLTINALDVDVPTDYHSIRSLECDDTSLNIKRFDYVEPSRLIHMRRQTLNHYWLPYYSIRGRKLMFSGPYTDAPTTVLLEYNTKVPDFFTEDASWVADEYLDIYVYAVLKQSAGFLREDERIATWQQLFADGINTAVDDSEHSQTRAPSAGMPLPRTAGSPRRRR